jgi:hypothetical protein
MICTINKCVLPRSLITTFIYNIQYMLQKYKYFEYGDADVPLDEAGLQ